MCKLSAIVPKKNFPDGFSTLIFMLLEGAERLNKDGYGISVINKNKVDTFKEGKDFSKEVGNIPLLKFSWEKYTGDEILIGHVRAASAGKGKICDENAHPFTMENITLAHNGHFGNFEEVNKNNSLTCVVDSQTFLSLLVKELKGTPFNINAFNKVAKELEGNYAFIIFDDLQPNKIFLAVGSNNLTIYESGYAYLVNTDKNLNDDVDKQDWITAFTTGKFNPYKVIELKNGNLYSLSSLGLEELGKIELNPYISNSYYGEGWESGSYYSRGVYSPASNRNLNNTRVTSYNTPSKSLNIEWDKLYESVSYRVQLLKEFPIGNIGLSELLENLPLIPDSISELGKFWCDLLKELMTHLETTGYLKDIDTKRMMWIHLFNKTPNFYDQILTLEEDVEVPYFMNSLERIVKLEDELIYAVDIIKSEINSGIG